MNTLPASVLLGWNVPQIINMVKPRDGVGPSETEALAVMKRQQGRQLLEAGDQPETDTQAAPTPTVPTPETDDYLSNLNDSLFSPCRPTKAHTVKM